MRAAANGNHARVVNHLVGDGHRAGPLHDAQVGVVDRRKRGAWHAAADATLPQTQVFGATEDRRGTEGAKSREGTGAAGGAATAAGALARLGRRWQTAVR